MPTEIFGDFEWDSEKRTFNLNKHEIDFYDAFQMFHGIVFDNYRKRYVLNAQTGFGEGRIAALGVLEGVVLLSVYTWRGHRRRIISMRKAASDERTDYISYIASIKNQLGQTPRKDR